MVFLSRAPGLANERTNHATSISGYRISRSGELTLLDADGVTASTGDGSMPIDAAFDGSSKTLYVLNSGSDTIAIFARMADGSLDDRGSVPVLDGAAGLAAF